MMGYIYLNQFISAKSYNALFALHFHFEVLSIIAISQCEFQVTDLNSSSGCQYFNLWHRTKLDQYE